MKFIELEIISPILKALEKENFTDATEIQSKVIPFWLEWKDILWCAQTWSGKTLAFALPILQRLYISSREEEKQDYLDSQADLNHPQPLLGKEGSKW